MKARSARLLFKFRYYFFYILVLGLVAIVLRDPGQTWGWVLLGVLTVAFGIHVHRSSQRWLDALGVEAHELTGQPIPGMSNRMLAVSAFSGSVFRCGGATGTGWCHCSYRRTDPLSLPCPLMTMGGDPPSPQFGRTHASLRHEVARFHSARASTPRTSQTSSRLSCWMHMTKRCGCSATLMEHLPVGHR